MSKLQIKNFDGEYPRTGATFLPESAATEALNVRLYSGELRTWDGPELITSAASIVDDAQTIYIFENPLTEERITLSWAADVDVQRSALDDTTDFRLYFTGDGVPKKTNWALANTDGDTVFGYFPPGTTLNMGVPAPTAAPTLGATTGSSTAAETRFYVYTNVSTFGSLTEESAPSPPTEVTITTSQSVDVSGFSAPPAGDYNITHRRIYRTIAGAESDGAYAFVKEVTVATTTTNDDLLAAALGEALETTLWDTPPDGLKGLTSMANGIMAGFVGNTVYFCEPYFHHAWPVSYAQSVPDQIVGLASYGNTLIVLTKGQPYGMIGITPDGMTVEKIAMPEPCASKRSIAVDEMGVVYASPNGIVAIGPTGRGVMSTKLFRRKEWQEYAPGTMIGAVYDSKYVVSYQSATKGNKTMVVSRDDIPALSFLDVPALSFFYDVQEGELTYLNRDDGNVYQVDSDPLNPFTYQWQSKRYVFDHAISWSVLRLDIDPSDIADTDLYNQQVAAIIAANQAITGDVLGSYNSQAYNAEAYNGSILQELPVQASSGFANVLLIDETDQVRATFAISSYDPVRIPPFRSRDLRVRITGNIPVRGITLATSFEELRGM